MKLKEQRVKINMSSEIIIPELPSRLKSLFEGEERIQMDSIVKLKSNKSLDVKLGTYEKAMDVIHSLAGEYKSTNENESTIQSIGIRLFNDLAIALRLMLSGYYQASFAAQRDIIEIYFLLDFFRHCPSKIIKWKNSSNNERKREFSPAKIRNILDKRDGFVDKKREKNT